MKNLPIKQRISALSIIFFISFAWNCRHRKQTQTLESEHSETGLDVNDVSFLYPPMGGRFPNPNADPDFGREIGSDYMEWLKESVCNNAPDWSDPQECEASTRPYQNESKRIIEAAQNLGLWPSASEFISEPLFNQIIGVSQGKGPVASFGIDFRIKHLVFGPDSITKINYGVDRYPNPDSSRRSIGFEPENYEFDFSSFKHWRVVSARYAPCPFQHVGPSTQNDEEVKGCTPEVRLVIQPFTELTQAAMTLGGWLPLSEVNKVQSDLNIRPAAAGAFAGDYAMHLFFRLSSEESNAVAKQLLTLKNDFQDECPTTGAPLFVHPCFRSALKNLGSKEPNEFPKRLVNLLKEKTKTLHKVAIMGSRRNSTPWFFYQGQINKQGLFELKGIKTIDLTQGFDRPGSEVDLTKNNNNSIARNGLRQGKVLMVRRSASLGSRQMKDSKIPASKSELQEVRLVPMPKATQANLDIFLRTPQGFQTNEYFQILTNLLPTDSINSDQKQKILLGANRTELLLEATSRIENPIFSHEFNVDCASCHLANTEGANERLGFRSLTEQMVLKNYPQLYSVSAERKNLYKPSLGISGYTFPAAVHHQEGPNRESYIFNQFSIYGREPRVSQRVVNESSEAANFANTQILKKQNPGTTVKDHFAMRECISGTAKRRTQRGNHIGEKLETDWFGTWMQSADLVAKCKDL
jgi:hypothetical protein